MLSRCMLKATCLLDEENGAVLDKENGAVRRLFFSK